MTEYPDCAGCGEPVEVDAIPEYYEHEDTGELAHVYCYNKAFTSPSKSPEREI